MVEEMKLTNHGSDARMGRKRSSSIQKANISTSKHNFPDLISNLPDSLLLHILSLLDMDEVMKTCLLSRKWRYLWKFIPCLCFQPFAKLFRRIELTNFIDRCLFHYGGSKIRKLHIIFKYKAKHAPLANSWIHFAIRHQVEDFKLDFLGGASGDDYSDEELTSSKFYKLPRSFYMCTSLTSLNLRACNLNLPDSFGLDSLKKLSLELLELCSDSIVRLSSSCPVLEDIYLSDCNSLGDLNIVITNAHVKRLEIFANDIEPPYSVRINAPTLLSLGIYRCCPSVMFHVEKLGSLISVDLIAEEWLTIVYGECQNRQIEKLLYDLRHVKHLKLCSKCTQVLSLMMLQGSGILSISATCLELNVRLEKWELPGISYLLQSCSNLEKLKIANQIFYEEIKRVDESIDKLDFEEEEYWASFETDLPSIMQNIKTIELNGLNGRNLEEFVSFLLKNVKVLERMVINTPKVYVNNFELMYKLCQRLTAFPRSSPIAKLIIT